MTKRLLVLGCGGHGRVVAEAARLCGYQEIAFLDDAYEKMQPTGERVLGPVSMLAELAGDWPDAIAAVGANALRLELFGRLQEKSFNTPSVIHPSAVVSVSARIGKGAFLAAGAIVNAGAAIGKASIINTGARIDHDCVIGDACHIAPGATLSGNVTVETRVWLGTGCAVRQGVTIGAKAMVGVGAAVVGDLAGGQTYVGVPARPHETSSKRDPLC